MGQIVSDVNDILNYQKSKKETSNKRQQVLQQIAKDEQTKTNLVKKALAAQRAKYGANGVNGVNMTTGAVLDRIAKETSAPYDEKRRTSLAKLKSVKSANSTNLLKNLLIHFDELVG